MTDHQTFQASFSAKWEHHMKPDGYCAFRVLEFDIESDNHSFYHLLEHMVETLPGMDQVILLMAQKIVQEEAMKGGSNATKN